MSAQPGVPVGDLSVEQFSIGKGNLTYLLKIGSDVELVLRRPPIGTLQAGTHDMAREYAVLAKLPDVFDKAPRALVYCDDPSIIGSPFFIMERKPGVVVQDEVPEIFGSGFDAEKNRALSTVLVDTLAELHSLDPSACGLMSLGRPDGFLARQVVGWTRRWKDSSGSSELADRLSEWLIRELPSSPSPTLLHNDWRLDNLAISPTDPGVCLAVYDWDMATRGDPLADLGTLMASWFDPDEDLPDVRYMPTTVPGWLDRSKAIERYMNLTGVETQSMDWYLVFGAWKLAVVLHQLHARWLRGQTRDERFSTLGQQASDLLKIAATRLR
jgi:aminoglycoside phosphotransferase (APT) family kinase protein